MRGLNFTAVDFETANGFRGSPCAIGLVRVRDGVEAETHYTLLRPPEGFDRFDPRNIGIHGITPEAAASAPRFGEAFDEVAAFIGADTLVAHNVTFDLEVLESALEVSGIDGPGLSGLCSVRLARAVYQLPSHALPKAAAEAGFDLKHHHHALWDARASAAIVVDIARRQQTPDPRALFGAASIEPEVLEPWTAPRVRESRATRQIRGYGDLFDATVPLGGRELPDLMRWQEEGRNLPANQDADPSHPFFGEHVSFTGNLVIPRGEAKQLVAGCGGTTSSRVTGSTSILVIGDGFDEADLAADRDPQGPLGSNKAKDALKRRETGQSIRMVSERAFRQLAGAAWPYAP
ncbi:exonuclease domain-containing protein [Nesterenkonia sp. NBAIMH1]|uniref:exonuclease domain-containing protein n=1 Tax=Nesterenkonia sp. NBAIMH1 TaxID=2600320 RepID=UPI0011B807CA|nr:exonuclease domain-containing protein [Nesterenkonia sp. NBAIMH1]